MKNTKIKMRVLSFFSLLVLLLPLITLSVFASPYSYFDFVINGSYNTQKVEGRKTDMGESSSGSAGVTLTSINLSVGSMKFFITDYQNYMITAAPLYMSSTGTGTLYYDMDELNRLNDENRDITVTLNCAPNGTIWLYAGRFEP